MPMPVNPARPEALPAPPLNDPTNREPKIGLYGKGAIASVIAMKKIPRILPNPLSNLLYWQYCRGVLFQNSQRKKRQKDTREKSH